MGAAFFARRERAASPVARDVRRAVRQGGREERSEGLANRTGICLACGNEFNLKRITAKTCSPACKKRLQRKPELQDQYLEPFATTAQDLDDEISAVIRGESNEGREKRKDERTKRGMNEILPHAPALFAWLRQQPLSFQHDAIYGNKRMKVLGAQLSKEIQW